MIAPLIGAQTNIDALRQLSAEVDIDFWWMWFENPIARDLVSSDYDDSFSMFIAGGPL